MRGEQRKGGGKKESPLKRDKLVAGWGDKKTGVGVKKKTAGGVPKKKRAGWHKTYPRRYLENVVAAMAEKTDGWAGKNGGSGKEKKRAVRAAKKTDFEVGKKNGGEVKKKTGDGW